MVTVPPSASFSCALCACHWPLLLIPTVPSVSHSCNCLPGSLSPCLGACEQRNFSAACSRTRFNSPFPPMQCELLCPAWGAAVSPSHSLGSAWGAPQLHWPGQGWSAQEGWCEMVDAACPLGAFKSSNTSAPFHLCPSSPSFLSSSAPVLEVSWSSAQITQLAEPASSYFHFFAAPAVWQCSGGNPVPAGSDGHRCWGTKQGEILQQTAGAAGERRKRQQHCPRSAAVSCGVRHPVPSGLGMHTTHHPVGPASRS